MSTNAPTPWLDRIAHDLRGPLSPVQTAIGLLRTGELEPARQRDLLEMIDRQTRVLARMIGELDDWSRASQGTLLGTRLPCSAAATLDNALAAIAADAPALRIADDSGDAVVDGDEWRLCQLLRILIEYTQSRGTDAMLSMRREGDALRIDVRMAMDGELRPTLLTEPAPEPHDGGLGLRLPIARAIAEAHGGSLTATQDATGVATLHCSLPLSTD
jgi:signal transduction histidine kinase